MSGPAGQVASGERPLCPTSGQPARGGRADELGEFGPSTWGKPLTGSLHEADAEAGLLALVQHLIQPALRCPASVGRGNPVPLPRTGSCRDGATQTSLVKRRRYSVRASTDRHAFASGSHTRATKQGVGPFPPQSEPCTRVSRTEFRPKVSTVHPWLRKEVTTSPTRKCDVQPPVEQNRETAVEQA